MRIALRLLSPHLLVSVLAFDLHLCIGWDGWDE